ncbi:MAG: hypothetical protein P1V36_12200, partial [Planctomycetota bacterium]|nr:hypothetical protein [Planctomycetota bacterium]
SFIAESSAGANDGSQGGGGGGFSATGTSGATSAGDTSAFGGGVFGDARFMRDLALFQPDRGYQPNANASGGNGGGGGSLEDDNGASETGDNVSGPGDDAGAGGGGAGGAIWVIAETVLVGPAAVLTANGGKGGNTYGPSEQLFDPGEDGNPGTADDVFLGLAPGAPATGTGDGGPGGGGSGGAIFLIGKMDITVDAGATIEANGGAGGTSNNGTRAGGAGALGRIALLRFAGGSQTIGIAAPNLATAPDWQPTVDEQSTGQSDWVDLFTPTADFAPLVNGQPQFPTFNGNFQFPGAAIPGFLETPMGSGGGGQTHGVTFEGRLEFQGADFLLPEPGVGTPTSADGLTTWFDWTTIDSIDGKRYIRWRWRFWTESTYGSTFPGPGVLPVPTVFDLTIPFIK